MPKLVRLVARFPKSLVEFAPAFVSPPVHDLALVLAHAAPNGTRAVAYAEAVRTHIGPNPIRRLYRNGVNVWSRTISGMLTVEGSEIVLPEARMQYMTSVADIATGMWMHRVENASDATKFIENTVTPPEGEGQMKISNPVGTPLLFSLAMSRISAPELDTVSISEVLSPTDPRTFATIDPSLPFPDQPVPVLNGIGGNWFVLVHDGVALGRVRMLRPEGIMVGAQTAFGRVPDGTQRSMFVHQISPFFPKLASIYSNAAIATEPLMRYGIGYWIAFTIRVANWPERETALFELTDDNSSKGPTGRVAPFQPNQHPLRVMIDPQGRLVIRTFGASHENWLGGEITATTHVVSNPVSLGSSLPSDWQRFVLYVKASRTGQATLKVWRQIGLASEELLVERSGNLQMGYLDTPRNSLAVRLGPNQLVYGETPSAITVYSKGAIVLRDQPGLPVLNESVMFEAMRAR